MDKLTKFFDWLVFSSVDPSKVGLTAKSFLLGLIPLASLLFPVFGLNFDVGVFQEFVDASVNAIIAILTAVSTAGLLVGITRKLYNTFK